MPIIYDQPGQFASDTTLEDLVQEVLLKLHGYAAGEDQITALSQDLSADSLTLQVEDVNEISRGTVEVGNELIRVQSVDRVSGTVTILPRGRGFRGSEVANHEAGDTVTMAPLAPRLAVVNAINDSIVSLYPDLFGVATVEFTVDKAATVTWPLPVEAESALSVRYRDSDGNWQRVRQWEVENRLPDADFPSGKGIRVTSVPLGQTVQVVFSKAPTPLRRLVDSLSSTGLLPGWRDIVVLGAQYRIIPSLDVGRLSIRSVAADQLDQPNQLGSAVQLAKTIQAEYDRRVKQERFALLNRYPAPVHFVR